MVPLTPGVNTMTFVATDALGHTSTIVRTVVRDNTAPSLSLTAPADTSTTTALAGSSETASFCITRTRLRAIR
jgi:hypothetical protein